MQLDARFVTHRVVWSVCLSICLSVVIVNPAKTADSIEIPFGLWTGVGPGNRVLDGGFISHGKGRF